MELTAYVHPSWAPLIRPAPATRGWMDAAPEAFAYRCLPLNIANAHGWEILNPVGFEAVWDGGDGPNAVVIRPDAGANASRSAVSLFGLGVVTFHVEAILRTSPGWNLWIGGSPNRLKDGLAPLAAVVETDWSPYTFTMNWRFTRPGCTVRFEAMEPFAFVFPVPRSALEDVRPKFAALHDDPATEQRFADWSKARDAFQAEMRRAPPKAPADRWQKHYYLGVDVAGDSLIPDHRSKLRLHPFDRSGTPAVPAAPSTDAAISTPARGPSPTTPDLTGELARLKLALAKRDWLLQSVERQRTLVPAMTDIERRSDLSQEEFLTRYYAAGRPVILVGELNDWPALGWTPQTLKAKLGSVPIEYQGGREANARFERDKDRHRRRAPFDAFIDSITSVSGNDAYMTAYNSAGNSEALAPLSEDLGSLDRFLSSEKGRDAGMMWIGPAGSFTALHHDLTNNFIVQVVGRKQVKLMPAAEVGRLDNDEHVFSRFTDLDKVDSAGQSQLQGARFYDILLRPGDILFVPLAWWHQVRAVDFSVTLTYTNFRWRNDGYANYPTAP